MRVLKHIAGPLAKRMDILVWSVDPYDDSGRLHVYVTIDLDRYEDQFAEAMGVAGDVADQRFGEGNYSGPWHEN